MPIVLRGPSGAGVRAGPFHSQSPEMHFVHTPGIKVVVPATVEDAYGLMKAAVRDEDPVLFLEHKKLYRHLKVASEALADSGEIVPLGRLALRRGGQDLLILTYGAMVHTVLAAAERLAEGGIQAEVVDLRSLVPLDTDGVLSAVRRLSKVMIVHEDTRTGGFGAELAAIIAEQAFDELDGPILRVTAPDTPVPYAAALEDAFVPQVEDVVAAARKLVSY